MSYTSFIPHTTTAARAVSAASQAVPALTFLAPVPSAAQQAIMSVMDTRLTNIGTVPAFVAIANPGDAAPAAAIPADGALSTTLLVVVEPNSTRTIQAPLGVQLAVISSGVGSTLYVTQGRGVNW